MWIQTNPSKMSSTELLFFFLFTHLHVIFILQTLYIPVSGWELSGLETVIMLLCGTSLVSVPGSTPGPDTPGLRPTMGSALPSALEPRCTGGNVVFLRSLFLSPEGEIETIEIVSNELKHRGKLESTTNKKLLLYKLYIFFILESLD